MAFLSGHPAAAKLFAQSYGMLAPQIVLMPFLLWIGGQGGMAGYRFAFAFVLFVAVAVLCCIPFPSYGALVGQGVDPHRFAYVSMQETFDFIAALDRVRNAPDFVLSVKTLSGIVTFPSVHAGMAALFIWTIWPAHAVVRYPVVALNLVMMGSALACGGHYLVDVIAGVGLALGVAWVARNGIAIRWSRPFSRASPPPRASPSRPA